ncbi:AAA family ATPase [Fervidobacterium thailandense]|uniref:AAA family ATPase n=1 Tax=Fervidobacterium thailandense TaxID=1008305 RepID=UPI0008FC67C3|nr:AAA family ATPase [Fervidobacterium thailandense]
MKFLPLGLSDFRTLIESNYIYVDKTKFLYELAFRGGLHFLSRRDCPRILCPKKREQPHE